MKETKVYMNNLPETCDECPCHSVMEDRCVLLRNQAIEPFLQSCPLHDLNKHDKELVTKVLEKAKSLIIKYDLLKDYQGCAGYFMLDKIIDQIQKEFEK